MINKPPPLNRDYNRDRSIKAPKRREFILHGSPLHTSARLTFLPGWVFSTPLSSGSLLPGWDERGCLVYWGYIGIMENKMETIGII